MKKARLHRRKQAAGQAQSATVPLWADEKMGSCTAPARYVTKGSVGLSSEAQPVVRAQDLLPIAPGQVRGRRFRMYFPKSGLRYSCHYDPDWLNWYVVHHWKGSPYEQFYEQLKLF